MEANEHLDRLMEERPELSPLRTAIEDALSLCLDAYRSGGKLLLCGNGGSACDAEHIAGELMKGFLLSRPLVERERDVLAPYGDEGRELARCLQRAAPAIVLGALHGLSTAFINDVGAEAVYAQQAFAYARPGDVLIGITTSGDAKNIRLAAIAAKARGASVIGLTGRGGGKLAAHCDVLIAVDEVETYRVQEAHLPVYHALCAMIEAELFG